MNYEEFIMSISEKKPPVQITKYLTVLWYDAKGKWDIAHKLAQSIFNNEGSLLHAYLHRKEGDLANASYWYSNAGKEMPNISLTEEWEELVIEFLKYKSKD
jgi:hypothetical protein